MNGHIVAVIACWFVAFCGFGMLRHAHTRWRQIAAHGAVTAALVALSWMALDHDHRAPQIARSVFGTLGEATYHAAGCPLLEATDVVYRSSGEAQWAGKCPCTFCLVKEAQHAIGHGAD